jgi:hypothetical protein
MQKLFISGVLAIVLSLSASVALAEDSASNPAFERIKQLAGTWQGTTIAPDTGKETQISVQYEVTSGGAAVIERNFAGTPHEMISVYYPEGKEGVGMTHYCAIGNRPALSLSKADDHSIAFEMMGTNGIASADEPHMHALTLTFNGKDELKQDWGCFKDSKANGHVTINLQRH